MAALLYIPQFGNANVRDGTGTGSIPGGCECGGCGISCGRLARISKFQDL